MRLVLIALAAAVTAALLVVAGVRGAALLSDGAELDWWTVACGVLGLVALVGILAVGSTRSGRTLPR